MMKPACSLCSLFLALPGRRCSLHPFHEIGHILDPAHVNAASPRRNWWVWRSVFVCDLESVLLYPSPQFPRRPIVAAIGIQTAGRGVIRAVQIGSAKPSSLFLLAG